MSKATSRAPGDRLLRLAEAWFDVATVSAVFEPLIADWQRECAPKSGLARVACRIRGTAAFAMSFTLTFATEFRKPLPIGLPAAASRTLALFVGIGVTALSVLTWNPRLPFEWMLPAHLAYALPIAITPFTVILLKRRRWPARELRKAALRVAMITTFLMIPLLGWGVPYANQQWRAAFADQQSRMTGSRVARRPPGRGIRELTLPELWSTAPPHALRWAADARRKELVQRVSLMFLPLPLVILGIATARIRRAPIVWSLACLWWITPPLMILVFSWWRTITILLAIAALMQVLTRRNAEVAHLETT